MSVKKLKRFSHSDAYDSNLFTCINYKPNSNPKDKSFVQIAAFDPGVVNTGCRIERRETLPDGKVIARTIKQCLFKTAVKGSSQHYYITMRDHLFSMSKELYQCDYILIESQMRNNPEATRMSQHIMSTLLGIVEGSNAIIIEILPTVKSRAFGINTGRGKERIRGKELKAWAVEEALRILKRRSDVIGESLIMSSKKKDDHADVVLYCDAWYRFLETNKFEP